MEVAVLPDLETIGRIGASRIVQVLADNPAATIGLATGSSPLPVYENLVEQYRAGRVSFAAAQAYCLDEYVGLPNDHPESYSNVISRVFTSQVDFRPGAVHAPDGLAPDLVAAAAEYDAQIHAAGGADIQLLGIGVDGHIGFNEPGGSLSSRTHLGFLAEQTRRDNARFFGGDIDQVPTACLTQGLGTIMEAHALVLVATGENKAEAVRGMIEGPVSAYCPASILQFHNNVTVLLDEAAAAGLKMRHEYQATWDGFRRLEQENYV